MKSTIQTASAEQRMLDTAMRLFKENGIQTTSVDQIIDESCSARGTLYHHFGSKAGLVVAALDAEGKQWRDWFFDEIASRADTPRDQLIAMFDVMQGWFTRENYSGCLFMNAIAECRSQDEEVRDATLRHKKLVNSRIRKLAKEAGASDPNCLTQQLDLLLDGLIITALVTKSSRLVGKGKEAAEILIKASLHE